MESILVPALQPIYDLQFEQVSHYEALARVRGDVTNRAHIQLIQIAEQCGFIGKIDIAMLCCVLDLLAVCSIPVAVNVSPSSVFACEGKIVEMLEKVPTIVRRRLILEITEMAPVSDLGHLSRFCARVRESGVRLALDDYGTANGSITEEVVRAVRPDFLKLDRDVLEAALRGDSDLEHAVNLAQAVSAEIVAEFVDSDEKVELLTAVGVRFAQGQLYGMPSVLNVAPVGL